jgi:hypothetical protein
LGVDQAPDSGHLACVRIYRTATVYSIGSARQCIDKQASRDVVLMVVRGVRAGQVTVLDEIVSLLVL